MTYTDSLLILGGLLSGGLGVFLLVFVLRSWLGERRRQRELQIAMNVLKFRECEFESSVSWGHRHGMGPILYGSDPTQKDLKGVAAPVQHRKV